MQNNEKPINYYRTVAISDVHLGTKMSQPQALLDFIKTFECERLYLVGDIIDGVNGCMNDDLETAVDYALRCNRKYVYEISKDYTWTKCTDSFVTNLRQIN